ncbi:MAG: hypothetical protein ABI867_34300 [Kofleriaceae bacterium]
MQALALSAAMAQSPTPPVPPAQPNPPDPQPEPQPEPQPVSPQPEPTPLPVVTEPIAEPAPPPAPRPASNFRRNFAGSIQLDYMAVPTENTARRIAFDGATAEVSLKIAMDFNSRISSNVKVCVACHGFEVGMAFFDLRVADELNFRVGRFTPSFGDFPVRHDPANHRTSDKPLPYDMGRMVRGTDWNQGVLPAPWVDNGLELNGTHYFGQQLQTSYALFAVGGPRAASNPVDFDFAQSRSGESYYIDNNSRPVVGGQVALSVASGKFSATVGASTMRGTYDPEHRLRFSIIGTHLVFRFKDLFLRFEYLNRRTKMDLGEEPEKVFKYGVGTNGEFDPYFVKEGAYGELEVPLHSRLTLVLREDGLRRRGNVVTTSTLRSDSMLIRHTAAIAVGLGQSVRLKVSYERYDFSDFDDESVIHTGIAGPF